MLSLQVSLLFEDEHNASVLVTTKRCRYQVWVSANSITVNGPGVSWEIEEDEQEYSLLFNPDLSVEGAAAIAVLFFEESNQ